MPFITVQPIKESLGKLKESVCLPKEDFEQRYAHCLSCSDFDSDLSVCKQCGCYMRWKAQLKMAKCPIGKW